MKIKYLGYVAAITLIAMSLNLPTVSFGINRYEELTTKQMHKTVLLEDNGVQLIQLTLPPSQTSTNNIFIHSPTRNEELMCSNSSNMVASAGEKHYDLTTPEEELNDLTSPESYDTDSYSSPCSLYSDWTHVDSHDAENDMHKFKTPKFKTPNLNQEEYEDYTTLDLSSSANSSTHSSDDNEIHIPQQNIPHYLLNFFDSEKKTKLNKKESVSENSAGCQQSERNANLSGSNGNNIFSNNNGTSYMRWVDIRLSNTNSGGQIFTPTQNLPEVLKNFIFLNNELALNRASSVNPYDELEYNDSID
ncbi:MAG: hypothetical protein LBB12_00825 [Holosporaceae bacterium]|jgi:hypothetical protein|nr:hypothetical protein [Holosporaceae bacterium]